MPTSIRFVIIPAGSMPQSNRDTEISIEGETRRRGDKETRRFSPFPLFPLSPCLLVLSLWLCVFVANLSLGRDMGHQYRRYEDSRVSMGCLYSVVVYGSDLARLREAAAAALDEVDRIDRLMSNYKNDSELSRVNREAAKAPVKVDPELFDFIAECLRYSRESEGAFDITVGPLMKAWGFFRGEGRLPTPDDLAAARRHVGAAHVILDAAHRTISFDE